jgi:hypothetical protein
MCIFNNCISHFVSFHSRMKESLMPGNVLKLTKFDSVSEHTLTYLIIPHKVSINCSFKEAGGIQLPN